MQFKNSVINLGTIPLSKIEPFQHNMKTLSDENYQKLRREIEETGFSFAVHVWEYMGKTHCLDGHQRIECLKRMYEGRPDPLVPVVYVQASSFAEAKRKTLSAASQYGEFNTEGLQKMLAEIEIPQELVAGHFSIPQVDLSQIVEVKSHERVINQPTEELYTRKIQAPVYEPKGEKPEVSELIDRSKAKELEAEIVDKELPDEVRFFLLYAAQRHAVFHYDKIAEYYAHAPAEIQDLMEKSALVIIDFKKAIENGFVVMTKEISDVYARNNE